MNAPQDDNEVVIHEFVVQLSDFCNVVEQSEGLGLNRQLITEGPQNVQKQLHAWKNNVKDMTKTFPLLNKKLFNHSEITLDSFRRLTMTLALTLLTSGGYHVMIANKSHR